MAFMRLGVIWRDASTLEVSMRWARKMDDPGDGVYIVDLESKRAEKIGELHRGRGPDQVTMARQSPHDHSPLKKTRGQLTQRVAEERKQVNPRTRRKLA